MLSLCTRRLVRDWPARFGHELEQENRELREAIDALEARQAEQKEARPTAAAPESESTRAPGRWNASACAAATTTTGGFVHVDSEYGYEILDPTTHINRKQRLILERKQDGTLAPDRLHLHGAVTAIASYQSSNRDDKFGYLMRHPTAANQVGDTVSEVTIHSTQLGFGPTSPLRRQPSESDGHARRVDYRLRGGAVRSRNRALPWGDAFDSRCWESFLRWCCA